MAYIPSPAEMAGIRVRHAINREVPHMVLPGMLTVADTAIGLAQGESLPEAVASGVGTGVGGYALARVGGVTGGLAGNAIGRLAGATPAVTEGLIGLGALAGGVTGLMHGADKGNDVAVDLLNKHLNRGQI